MHATFFDVFDSDESGSLSAAEVLAVLTRQGGDNNNLTEGDAQEIVNDFDTNGDGVLDVSEFVAAFSTVGAAEANHKAEMQQQWTAKGFKGAVPTVGLDRPATAD